MSELKFFIGLLLFVTLPLTSFVAFRYRFGRRLRSVGSSLLLIILISVLALAGLATPLIGNCFVIAVFALAFVYFSCKARKVPASIAILLMIIVTVAIDLPPILHANNVLRGIQSRLTDYPQISLADRLAYEADLQIKIDYWPLHQLIKQIRSGPSQTLSKQQSIELRLAPEVKRATLERLETDFDRTDQQSAARRQERILWALRHAHDSTRFQFNRALGFGVERIREPSYESWRLELPAAPPFRMAHARDCEVESLIEPIEMVARPELQPWHDRNLFDFTDPTTLGILDFTDSGRPDLAKAIGFKPHAFHTYPEPLQATKHEVSSHTNSNWVTWRMNVVSLVSLLKHRPGAVYVSEKLPNMAELVNVPTRPLNEFESRSLEQLKLGEDLIVNSNDEQIEMIGSIRAIYQCMECHQVARGTLLGAFSYRLSAIKPETIVD